MILNIKKVPLFFSWIMVVFVSCWVVREARANPTSFQVQQFRPKGDPSGLFHNQSARTLGQWKSSLGFFFNYALDPIFLVSQKTGREVKVLEHQIGLDLIAAVGILDWLDVALEMPLTLYQMGILPRITELGDASGRSLDGFALGDLRLRLKAQFLSQKKGGTNLGMRLFLGVPSGEANKMNGEGGVSFGVALLFNHRLDVMSGGLEIFANAGYRYQPDTFFMGLVIGQELTYGAGARLGVVKDLFDIIAEIGGVMGISGKVSSNSSPLGGYAGIRLLPMKSKALALNLGFGFGIMGGYGSPKIRLLLGLVWTNAVEKKAIVDSDADGVPDDKDRCPQQLGDMENQGCPLSDSDHDGVPDNVDRCPNLAGTRERQGCPVPDADHDGIDDQNDKCPNRAGPRENQGCPRPTPVIPPPTRNDVTAPSEPVARTTPPPEKRQNDDWDRDGIPNRRDRCPYLKGSRRRRGCPRRVYVRIRRRRKLIWFRKRLVFKGVGTRMYGRTKRILRQFAELLRNRPNIRIKIIATTYSRSRRRWVSRLSRRRARAIRAFLVKHGVDLNRIQFRGYRRHKRRGRTRTYFRIYVMSR